MFAKRPDSEPDPTTAIGKSALKMKKLFDCLSKEKDKKFVESFLAHADEAFEYVATVKKNMPVEEEEEIEVVIKG